MRFRQPARLAAVPRRAATVPTIRIRHACDADLAALVALENRVFSADRLSARQWRHHLRNGSADVLVADGCGALVGAAVVFFHVAHRIARLYSIAIAPEARGAGLGDALLASAERSARKRGSSTMRLEVRADNVAAQRLYERRGYRQFGIRRDYYEDGADALRYEKALAPARVRSPGRARRRP
jgi:ribosomal-protein-alanine acetyltransferase